MEAQSGRRVVMEAREIRKALERFADEVIESATDRSNLAIVGIRTGGVHLANRLHEIIRSRFQLDLPAGALDITLYRDDWTRLHNQPLVRSTELPFPIEDREIVLIDDVLFTGRTIRAALDALMDYGRPRRVQVAVLVDRGHRELPICAQFVGLQMGTAQNEKVNVLLTEKDGLDQVVVEPV
ncbi:MAG: bifunctional pyr operon transcriptional regulator/uracil phosphoribosyltransferase PyrR [Syntrophobacteraceae bacterium]